MTSDITHKKKKKKKKRKRRRKKNFSDINEKWYHYL